jgi:hypothetical protein
MRSVGRVSGSQLPPQWRHTEHHIDWPELRPRIRFGAKMIAPDQGEQSATVHYHTPAVRFQATGDHVLVTVLFTVLRHVEALDRRRTPAVGCSGMVVP